ncbi:3-hydroxyacyl-CoA dehydrogenase [Burkholderia multivorans]|nr:3-hydroxyacyl-CoA dehydrogenase [Burkholderia multivorans]MBR7890615.1 3-hydroxyacyl-CoA dehydrogenase [Burkholderia multivorans]MBR8450705.1 3-hydroxyacyl-CoA dehydrogenase [Burkholderia multivorans]MCL4646485.1 3-hydroxyacyl-CoA dehydrogenase [Burkholderia multivorans]PRG38915.1 3-hydroxyacyl-CoA dehydrogenase [Burkholderia multivorans]UQN89970.1 3-hydroxyacyl-CoA dehydrogenase [Burkholderia multivorans]
MNMQTTTSPLPAETVGIVGAGAMGRGIAQIAALAGLTVKLFDTNPQALDAARSYLAKTFAQLADKGKLSAGDGSAALARVLPCSALEVLADCDLVIEAIVERLDVKRQLIGELEAVLHHQAIIASNTSSLSITAIAAGAQHPGRIAGYHFFNPVPLMKVVEVVDGLSGDPAVGDALMALARRMGHTPVRCKDMPGFIVNHAGRGMNIEGLKVAQEGVASFADIDDIMREQAGFRMGPFELMDLTGLDVSHPVMESIYHQYYQEPRYRPSPITAIRAVAGLVGRKAGAGFYRYENGRKVVPPAAAVPSVRPASVWVSRENRRGHDRVMQLLATLDVKPETGESPSADALIVVTPLGHDATTCAVAERLDAARVIAIDTLLPFDAARRRTLMTTPVTTAAVRDMAYGLFASDGVPVTVIRDSAGFVAQRIVCSIVNIASDIAQQRIASPADIDRAVHLGLGYPQGPLALGDAIGPRLVLEILRNLTDLTGDMRYRPSPWLWRRAELGLSLLTEDA